MCEGGSATSYMRETQVQAVHVEYTLFCGHEAKGILSPGYEVVPFG